MNVLIFNVNVDMTDEDVRQMICTGYAWAVQHQRGCLFSVDGFNHDPRGLFQIPEALALMTRLRDMGFMSVLHTSTLITEDGQPADHPIGPLGAIELWAMSKGYFGQSGEFEMTPDLFRKFQEELAESNAKCDLLLAGLTPDGAHRHGGER